MSPEAEKESGLTRPAPVRFTSLFALSFVAGYVDLVGFVAAGVFTGHITGNLAVAGSALARRQVGDWLRVLVVLPGFVGAVVLASGLVDLAHRRGRSALVRLLMAETASLLLLMLLGLHIHYAGGPTPWAKVALVGCSVTAMAIQNVTTELETSLSTTTAMTVNLARLTRKLVDYAWMRHGPARHSERRDLVQLGYSLGGFVTGAAVGTLLFVKLHYSSLCAPFLLSVVATATVWRERGRMRKVAP